MASTNPTHDQWYHDTGSNTHLTNELANLSVRADEYTGSDQILVGYGQGLQIPHAGTANLCSPSHTFCLSSLLHAPQIHKNLISAIKFSCDNRVFVEFHHDFSLLRTSTPANSSSKARVEVGCIHGPPSLLLPMLSLLTSERRFPWINGINV
jgi:hypothetical protein